MTSFQCGDDFFIKPEGLRGIFVAGSGRFFNFGRTRLKSFQILQLKLHVDHFLISNRVDTPVYVNDISIVKAPEDMEYGIGFSNVPQELVAKPLSLAGSLDQARDVDNFDRRRNDILWFHQFC